MYDPYLSRFTTFDPVRGKLGEPMTLHKYLYCHANPVNAIDPSGEMAGFFSLSFSITNILIGLAIALPIVAIVSGWPLYVYRFTNDAYLTITKKTLGANNKKTYTIRIREVSEFESEIKKVEQSGDKIVFFEFTGHGFGDETEAPEQRGWGLIIGGEKNNPGGFITHYLYGNATTAGNKGLIVFDALRNSIVNAFASDALIELEACYSAFGNDSIAHKFKKALPNASVWGYIGWTIPWLVVGVQEAMPFGGWTEVK